MLLVPGGFGTRSPDDDLRSVLSYIGSVFPRLKYLFTVCSGSGLAARAGVLDGVVATTNKRSWERVTGWREQVRWDVGKRWCVDVVDVDVDVDREGDINIGEGVGGNDNDDNNDVQGKEKKDIGKGKVEVWTTSGVSAGMDGIFAWMAAVYGEHVARNGADVSEFVRTLDPEQEPFARLYGLV